jgi:hypothetical protein
MPIAATRILVFGLCRGLPADSFAIENKTHRSASNANPAITMKTARDGNGTSYSVPRAYAVRPCSKAVKDDRMRLSSARS